MTQHILLVMVTGLLAVKYDEPNERFLRYLWILACIIWVINVISDVIKMIGQNARSIGKQITVLNSPNGVLKALETPLSDSS